MPVTILRSPFCICEDNRGDYLEGLMLHAQE